MNTIKSSLIRLRSKTNRNSSTDLSSLIIGIPVKLPPPVLELDLSVSHAPKRITNLDLEGEKQAVRNALRYFPTKVHSILAKEFFSELHQYGHIYMYRFRPIEYTMKAYPISYYPAKCKQAAAIMHMIMNNLDSEVAQHPHELITYGGNGSVFSNWAQYHLVMKLLCEMTKTQTLTLYSGHPLGLFPSHQHAPRLVITNGMVIPNYSSREDYNRMYALGVSQYGQMTAGSFVYIGPQGIVHGTTITILGAARKYLNKASLENSGVLYVTSGLGGMSGAQGKAGTIVGAITIIAEVDFIALKKRYTQGWIQSYTADLEELIVLIRKLKTTKQTKSIGYLGNVVELWEKLSKSNIKVELGSDQTSLHNPYGGGYYPVDLLIEESKEVMVKNPTQFKSYIKESLRRHVNAINTCVNDKDTYFWDYGNCFLLEALRAQADILSTDGINFKYPSYIQDIMGEIFGLGFGPYRWCCTSGDPNDLALTDQLAHNVLLEHAKNAPDLVKTQLNDNIFWISNAGENKLVVGSQSRILYANDQGRIDISLAMNKAVKDGKLKGPVVVSRDHHDVSGTDSPFRETSDVYDGSKFCADMAVHNFVGDSFRGATWVSLHNGGGVGWGEVINGGFGLVLDGTDDTNFRIKQMLYWDVNNGIARRAWAGGKSANFQINRAMKQNQDLKVIMPNPCRDEILSNLFD